MLMPKRTRIAGPDAPLFKTSAEMLRTRLLTIEWRVNWLRWTVEMESEFNRFSKDVAAQAHKQLRTVSWQDEHCLMMLSTVKLPRKDSARCRRIKRFALDLAAERNVNFKITLR
jgi:hypothetical protein